MMKKIKLGYLNKITFVSKLTNESSPLFKGYCKFGTKTGNVVAAFHD